MKRLLLILSVACGALSAAELAAVRSVYLLPMGSSLDQYLANRLTSENLEDSPQVTVSAMLVSPARNDSALENIIGRMSLEPFVTAAHWNVDQAAAEA